MTTNIPNGRATSEMNQSPSSFNFEAKFKPLIHHQRSAVLDIALMY